MKTYYILVLLVIIIMALLFFTTSFHRSHEYSLKLINKFAVPELPKNTNHMILDGYSVSFAISDSIIYIIDTTDSTKTKSYSYNFEGVKQDRFKMPDSAGYWQPVNDNCFYYLPESKQLAFLNVHKLNMDFYDLTGKLVQRKHIPGKLKECYMDMAEFNGNRYYISIAQINQKGLKIKLNLYEEQQDKEPKLIRSIVTNDMDDALGIGYKILQIDNFNKTLMAISEVMKRDYKVTVYQADKQSTIYIPKAKTISKSNEDSDMPYQFVLGKNFMVMGSIANGVNYPLKYMIYDLKGHKAGKRVFTDDPKNELVDIVGDKLVAFNPATVTISVYQIEVR